MEIKPNELKCSVVDCDKKIHSRGMCQSHYRKLKRSGAFGGEKCSWDKCSSTSYSKGMCAAHYQWSRVNGKFTTKVCSVNNCATHQYAKGYCTSHYWILSNYKLQPEMYEQMLVNQSGKCAICGTAGKLVIDHNHATDSVRELLCSNCNTALGLLKENKETLNNLIKYLEKHS